MERFLDRVRKARTDAEIIEILRNFSAALGFGSGFLIEYVSELKSALHILDSNGDRQAWWQAPESQSLRSGTGEMTALLGKGGVQVLGEDRFSRPNDPALALARKMDMVDLALVPISFDGAIIGLGGFSGRSLLSENQRTTLQLMTYNLFAQTRSFRAVGIRTTTTPLTPREKEVIGLSADGLTSQQIADRLGMSPRTVNQHVDNVAGKLGTKNRAHTVAEVIRHGLLD